MKLRTVELKGYSSFKDPVAIEIPMGITGIFGSIEDSIEKSNGSGKTSLVSSLKYALFGAGEFDKAEEVWNDKLGPKEDAYVRWSFELSGVQYLVDRGRKSGGGSYLDVFENYEDANNKGVRKGDSVPKAQEFINKLMGMGPKLFDVSIFFTQGDLAAFIETEGSNRREHIDSALDLGIWRSAGASNTTTYNSLNKDIKALQEKLVTVESDIADHQVIIDQLALAIIPLPVLETQKAEKVAELKKVQNASNVKASIDQYVDLLKKAKNDEEEALTEQNRLQDLLSIPSEDFTNAKTAANRYSEYAVAIDREQVQTLVNINKDIDESLNETQQDYEQIISDTATNVAEINRHIEDKKQVAAGVCSTCKQPVDSGYVEKFHAEQDKKIKKFQKTSVDLTRRKTEISEIITAGNADIASNVSMIDIINKKIENHTAVMSELKAAEKREDKNKKETQRSIDILETKISTIVSDAAAYTDKLEELRAQLPEGGVVVDAASLQTEITALDKQIAALNVQKGQLVQKQEIQAEAISKYKLDKVLLAESEETFAYLGVLAEAFKDIPTQLLQDSVIEIERHANEIIQSVYPRFRISIFEDIKKKARPIMIAFEVDGNTRNYKRLSGGQKAICAIALRIGINKVISRRSAVSLNFLVLDEVFGSLDKHNRSEVMRILKGLTDLFPQILTITHTESESLFPSTIRVHMDGSGNSHIR